MYKNHRIIAIAPAYNEKGKIGRVVERIPRELVDVTLVVDDGSDDGSAEEAEALGAVVIRLGSVQGVGSALRRGIEYAIEHAFDIVVILAGNNKDDPDEIIRLASAIVDDGCDFVQGSRRIPGGRTVNAPVFREISTRLFSLAFTLLSGRRTALVTPWDVKAGAPAPQIPVRNSDSERARAVAIVEAAPKPTGSTEGHALAPGSPLRELLPADLDRLTLPVLIEAAAAGNPAGARETCTQLLPPLDHAIRSHHDHQRRRRDGRHQGAEAQLEDRAPLDQLAKLVATEPAPDVRTLRPELPESLALVLALALEKRPELRYSGGEQMARDLEAVLVMALQTEPRVPEPASHADAAFTQTLRLTAGEAGQNPRSSAEPPEPSQAP